MKTAILIDGDFFIKRALKIFGKLTAEELAAKLWYHSILHVQVHKGFKKDKNNLDHQDYKHPYIDINNLYRIFFYDCPPPEIKIHHPFTNEFINTAKSDRFQLTSTPSIWACELLRRESLVVRQIYQSKPKSVVRA